MCAAYGKVAESCNSMTECRVKMWRSRTGKSGASSVKLCSIPPTTEAFTENVHRCHLQVAMWKAALLESPPEMDAIKYGWGLDHLGVLVPRTVPSDTLSAPPDILQLIHCNCKAYHNGCRTAACIFLLAAPTWLWGRCGRHNYPPASSVVDLVFCRSDGSHVSVDTVHPSVAKPHEPRFPAPLCNTFSLSLMLSFLTWSLSVRVAACPSAYLHFCHFQFLPVGASDWHCLHPVHVAARKLGALSSVYVRVRKPVKIL